MSDTDIQSPDESTEDKDTERPDSAQNEEDNKQAPREDRDLNDLRPRRNPEVHQQVNDDQRDNIAQPDNVGQQGLGQDETDAAVYNGEFGLKGYLSLVLPTFALIAFVADIVSDVLLLLEYYSNGDLWYFHFTFTFIVLPTLFVIFADLSWLYIDWKRNQPSSAQNGEEGQEMIDRAVRHPPENEPNQPYKYDPCGIFKTFWRIVVGLCSFGAVVRIIQHMYYKKKKRTAMSAAERKRYGEQVKITKRDYTLLNFIFAFTETYCQVCLQLLIFTYHPGKATSKLCFSIITSLIFMPLAYADHYRSMRLQAPEGGIDRKDMLLIVYIFYYLGVFGGMTFRMVSICMFLAALPLTIGVPLINFHFLIVFIWLWCYHKPTYQGIIVTNNPVLRNISKVLYTILYSIANMLFFIDLYERPNDRNSPTKWRSLGYNIILYVESAVFIGLGFGLRNGFLLGYLELYAMVLFSCLLMHLVFIGNYYQFVHPSIGICYTCTQATSNDNEGSQNQPINQNNA